MSLERKTIESQIEDFNNSDEVTEKRIFENLQIDGLKPPMEKIRNFVVGLKKRLNGQGTTGTGD